MLTLCFFVMTTLTVDRYLNHNGVQVPKIGYVGTYCRPMVTSNSATTNRKKGLSAQVGYCIINKLQDIILFSLLGNQFSHTQT